MSQEPQPLTFQAEILTLNAEGMSVEVRLLPFGETIDYKGERLQFDAGAITFDAPVPVTVDHGKGAVDRIGLLTATEQADGLYGSLKISDTQLGRDVYQLMADGVITDVSAGVMVEPEPHRDGDGVAHRRGDLDHGSIVARGAFGEAGAGSKVLAVHSESEANMAEKETTETVEATEPAPEMIKLQGEVDGLRKLIHEFSLPGGKREPTPAFSGLYDFVVTARRALELGDPEAQKRLDDYVLADDTTTTAAGVIPDPLSTEIISIIDTTRPYINSVPRDPIGGSGMTISYPRVTQKPLVDVQATEKTEVASQATTIDTLDVPLLTYAGASDVALQLIERSDPSFVTQLFREYADVYAGKTEADATAAAVAAAGDTAVLADLGADGAATWAAVAAASGAVALGVRRPADTMLLSVDRWTQLLSLADTDGRPLVVFPPNGPNNAAGSGALSTFNGQYGGLDIVVSADAAAGTCVIYNRGRSNATVEQNPQQLRALEVSLLGMNMGIWSLFAHVAKYPDGASTLTLV